MKSLTIPSWASTVLSLIAGALAVLNQVTFGFGSPWQPYVTVALVFLAGLGISPLVGAQFRAALHLSHAASLVIAAVLAAVTLALTTLHVSAGLQGILGGVLTFLVGIGFAPGAVVAPTPGPAPQPAPPAPPAAA